VRKAYGAGLYAMSGPGFAPDACLALPTAMIAVMGPEAAVNAVYYNKLQAMPEDQRKQETEKLREEYRADIDIERLASELVIDAIVAPERLRDELAARFRAIGERPHDPAPPKRRSVTPM
jgi:acetyl-CoA carboxylase carboxyltransferase component